MFNKMLRYYHELKIVVCQRKMNKSRGSHVQCAMLELVGLGYHHHLSEQIMYYGFHLFF